MRKYREYSDEDVIKYSQEVNSMFQLLAKLGLKNAGGNYTNMRKILQRLNLNCEHWVGQAWNKDKRIKDWSKFTRAVNLKPHLIKERGHKCESCCLSEWMNQPITLEIEHIDGDRTNNSIDNLQLLCCNCHALTATWRNRKRISCLTE